VGVATQLSGIVEDFRAVSLRELDRRAALLRRVDTKYVANRDALRELLDRLREEYDVLEIDGRRLFAYETTYFDTPDLRCFRDHVAERRPRFKGRTRYYVDTKECVFEVKIKNADDETVKSQIEHPPSWRRRLTRRAAEFLRRALKDTALDPSEEMEASLDTRFRRLTLVARDGAERVTCDFDVELSRGRRKARMKRDLVLVETKSAEGESSADGALAELGVEPVSLSKYRAGIALLVATDRPEPARPFFDY
jgi:hypothetical protein